MFVCKWLVLCETVVHDSATNGLSMINAVGHITAPSFPVLHPKFAFAAVFVTDDSKSDPLAIRFVRETSDGDEILVDFPSTEVTVDRIQFFLNFPAGIRLNEEGPVQFRVDLREGDGDWYSAAKQSIQVSLRENKPPKLASKSK